jgi:hypothetical protein
MSFLENNTRSIDTISLTEGGYEKMALGQHGLSWLPIATSFTWLPLIAHQL